MVILGGWVCLISEVPLYGSPWMAFNTFSRSLTERGYLAHDNTPPPLEPPWEPRYGPTVGSYGLAVSS